jgi:hypothetical protein
MNNRMRKTENFWQENMRERNLSEDNIRMDLREIGLEAVDWIHVAQDRDRWRDFVNTVMKLWLP